MSFVKLMIAVVLTFLLLEVAAGELAAGPNTTRTQELLSFNFNTTQSSDNNTLVFDGLAENSTEDPTNVTLRSATGDAEESKNSTTGSILSLLNRINGDNVSTIIEAVLNEVNGTNITEYLRSRSNAKENVTEVNYLPDDYVLHITNHKKAQLRKPSITVGKLKKVMAYRSLGARGKLM